ncbi:hypothetical protein IP88_03430 [alpha proteobacterium AAP81b]|nr:hypothetical protein IP88_03430 [alpha proteobacterium AAP81b]
MRSLILLAVLLATPALAQRAPAAPAPPAAPAAPTDAELLARANAQLDAARAEIQRLRAIGAEAEALQASSAEVRARNERLVAIANELVAAFEARYGKTVRFAPFNRARVKFEAELAKTSERIYQNQADAVAVRPNEVNAADPAPKPE